MWGSRKTSCDGLVNKKVSVPSLIEINGLATRRLIGGQPRVLHTDSLIIGEQQRQTLTYTW